MSRWLWRVEVFALGFAVSQVGCATVINGTFQTVEITSTPPGATVVIEPPGRETRTPVSVELSRAREYEVAFSLEGYRPVSRLLKQVESGAVMGNIMLGGLIGMGVDYSSGAAYDLAPNPLHVVLVPVGAAGAEVVEAAPAPAVDPPLPPAPAPAPPRPSPRELARGPGSQCFRRADGSELRLKVLGDRVVGTYDLPGPSPEERRGSFSGAWADGVSLAKYRFTQAGDPHTVYIRIERVEETVTVSGGQPRLGPAATLERSECEDWEPLDPARG